MSNFKPQVRYMTSESRHDYNYDRYRVTSPYITKSFKTYAELKVKLAQVLGEQASSVSDDDGPAEIEAPKVKPKVAAAPVAASKPNPMDDDVDQDSADYFKSLAA